MTIKLLAGNDGKCAQIRLAPEELGTFGVDPRSASLASEDMRRMLRELFGALRNLCGLSRDGHFTAVAFRPLRRGGCRLDFIFTDRPCGRCFLFAGADDLLDALRHLSAAHRLAITKAGILPQEDVFAVVLPPSHELSVSELYILDEYAR